MEREKYDIAIIGCGPAGLSAAVNARVRRKSVILFGGELCSPKLQKSPLVNNYLGLPETPGRELREKFLEHARLMEIPIYQVKVDSVSQNGDDGFSVQAKNKMYEARAVILATGVTVFKLIEGEQEFIGRGVGYCATCDGPLYQGKDVAVIAYTPEGVEDANFLAGFCRKVYFIPGSGQVGEGLKPEVEVIQNQEPLAITGDGFVSGLKLDGGELAVDGVFIYRETYLPERLVPGLAVEDNHIKVDRNYSTNIKGIYAAGDCTGKPYQMAKAVGEGQVAALSSVQYLDLLN
ncbi:MAG: NAD(P)/FAD-dependent oxidoreductase [Firmicutes bacterium]|nr:NAD(P)/FAD-dependent oxidoreductase [Bacillota bacterium]